MTVSALPKPRDTYPPELSHLNETAAHILDEHTHTGPDCTVCGVAWPCARVLLAEHNLAGF